MEIGASYYSHLFKYKQMDVQNQGHWAYFYLQLTLNSKYCIKLSKVSSGLTDNTKLSGELSLDFFLFLFRPSTLTVILYSQVLFSRFCVQS